MNKFKVAFRGLFLALGHRSVLVQIILAVLVIAGGFILNLDYFEWLIFTTCIGMVISAEMINTAIEMMCDYIQPKYDEKIGRIKDLAAGAVLFVCLVAFVAGLIVLIHKIGG